MSLAYAASPHELSDANLHAVQTFLEHMERWVEDALAKASLLPIPKDQLARVIVSALEGALLFDRLSDEPKHLNAARSWITSLSSY
jgi:TetR/AcrR family transcriptional repressor of nem operon